MPVSSETTTLYLADHVGTSGEIRCLCPVRVVPNKRVSYVARWDDKDVFVKLFFDPRHAGRHWRREKQGIEALAARGLLSPSLLYAGLLRDQNAYVLITEALPNAKTLVEQWTSVASDDARIRLVRMLAEAVAAQHEAGILQQDLHLGNFLIAGSKVYSIDTSQMRVREHPVYKRTSLQNLGLLLAQLDPRYDQYAPAVFANYAAHRKWPVSNDDVLLVRTCIDEAREKRKRKFLSKIFRECTAFAVNKANDAIHVYDKRYSSAGFHRLYNDPDSFLTSHDVRYLKKGNTCTVARASVDGIEVVIKRYNIKGRWHGIRRAFRRTRASISWQNAHLLQFYDISTPRPIAFIEKRVGPVRHGSYFICEYVEGPNYREYFADHAVSGKSTQRMAEQIAETLATLARYRIRHGDMKATNIILSDGRTYLTDLDAMREYRTDLFFRWAHSRDVKRFLDNWASKQEVRKVFKEKIASVT